MPVGLLTMTQTNDAVVSEFSYGRRYLERKNAAPLDPLQLPLAKTDYQDAGVFRVFQDASPDSWGRHLLDRAAEEHGLAPTEFEYLTAHDQDNRIGALAFGADLDGPRPNLPSWRPEHIPGEHLDFSAMLDAVDKILNHEELSPSQRRYFLRGSSPVGGAQPKALVDYDGKKWIAKFSKELEILPTCRIELAAMRLAAKCGVVVPSCQVLDVGGRDVFLIERFDRTEKADKQIRRHMLSATSLIGSDDPQKGAYGDVAMAIRKFGIPSFIKKDLEEMFRRMVFNILVNNWDDHLRNHAFLLDRAAGQWRLSPAYDIVPQPMRDGDEANRLTLVVGKMGARASLDNALSRCGDFSLKLNQARDIIKDMTQIVQDEWITENKAAGVKVDKLKMLEESYQRALK
ncbi:type II toxin-antitoxin system HipA family toxin [Pseudodesulfovibrio pelocollis]|uniref:type II toxin-antitoxin system HipA family toxin n=1 Tax=Pseudodesulfovibrio pelocollis TaxID=3051432 RepID=UPI00255A77EA|nr:type II toxin-antitoxin system HipA family toxin [Pseudodesulfovibrio sp. SB368]